MSLLSTTSLVLLILISGIDENGSRYVEKEYKIEFDGKSRKSEYKEVLKISDDINPDDYSSFRFPVPHYGEIKNVKIKISGSEKFAKVLKLKDGFMINQSDRNVLASDDQGMAWSLGTIHEGDEIVYEIETEEDYGYGPRYLPVLDKLPTDQIRIRIKFPNDKWRLKYSVDNGRPLYFDSNKDTVFTWTDLPSRDESSFSDAPDDVLPGICFMFCSKTGVDDFEEWNNVYEWYSRMADSVNVPENLSGLLEIAGTPEEILSAIKDHCRYVAVEIGDGWYIPSHPKSVWDGGYGDCKDLTTLFINWLKAAGFNAWPVLVNADRTENGNPDYPTPFHFNHMIAGYESETRDTLYQDLTAEFCPLGYLPTSLYGSMAVPLYAETEPVRLGCYPSDPDSVVLEVSGELGSDNVFRGNLKTRLTGKQVMISDWRNKSTNQGTFDNYIQSFLNGEISRATYRDLKRIESDSGVIEFGADIFIRNFSYRKDNSLILKPWIFDVLDYSKKPDTTRTWTTFLRRNVVYRINYAAKIPESEYQAQADSSRSFNGDNISYDLVNSSHDDSLLTELILYLPPATLDPEAYNSYVKNRRGLSELLANRVVFLAK